MDPTPKARGIKFGAKFALVCIDEHIMDYEELVREVHVCKTVGDAFDEGFLIVWLSAFVRSNFYLTGSKEE
jgi:hypothetical protein